MWFRISRRIAIFLLSNRLLRRVLMEQAKKAATVYAMRYAKENLRRKDDAEVIVQKGDSYVDIPVKVE